MDAREYGIEAIGNLIPVDKDTCKQMVDYTLSLPSSQVMQSHLLNLLGESEDALNFVSKFLQLREKDAREQDKATKKAAEKIAKKLSGLKSDRQEKHTAALTSGPTSEERSIKKDGSSNPWSTEIEKPKKQNIGGRLSNNDRTVFTSELLDSNKTSQKDSKKQAKRSMKKMVNNLKDIESALVELEVKSSLTEDSGIQRRCNCMATRHPLFEFAPNCLNCGKIICTKEGLQPCSFCGKDLLSYQERAEIMSILKEEKYDMENKKDIRKGDSSSIVQPHKKPTKIVVSMGAGRGSLFEQQNLALKKAEAIHQQEMEEQKQKLEKAKIELEQAQELQHYASIKDINPDLLEARERLETLLNFQATGAERTKIIDQASDFELPNINSINMWSSPVERALQLKKQQKQMRKQQELEKARSGRGKKVIDMSIKDGKVILREKIVDYDDEENAHDKSIEDLENRIDGLKLNDEYEKTQNVWDYEADKKKWERPVYMTTEKSVEGEEDSMESSSMRGSKNTMESVSNWARVQFEMAQDSPEALLIALPTV